MPEAGTFSSSLSPICSCWGCSPWLPAGHGQRSPAAGWGGEGERCTGCEHLAGTEQPLLALITITQ